MQPEFPALLKIVKKNPIPRLDSIMCSIQRALFAVPLFRVELLMTTPSHRRDRGRERTLANDLHPKRLEGTQNSTSHRFMS